MSTRTCGQLSAHIFSIFIDIIVTTFFYRHFTLNLRITGFPSLFSICSNIRTYIIKLYLSNIVGQLNIAVFIFTTADQHSGNC
jgi:hypothetical protein